jgi:hypothetical protein
LLAFAIALVLWFFGRETETEPPRPEDYEGGPRPGRLGCPLTLGLFSSVVLLVIAGLLSG